MTQRAFLLILPVLVACQADPQPVPPSPVASPSRLHAEGTGIVDAAGDAVQLRGVALGGWMFHENWITGVDFPAFARLHQIGLEAGEEAAVNAAIVVAGPAEDADADWVLAVRGELEPSLGVPATDAILESLASYPSVVDDSDLALRLVLEDRFGIEGRDEILDAFQGAWIQDQDLEWIAAQGWNVVRVPLGWRGLTSMTDHEPPSSLVWNEAAFARLDALLDSCETHGLWAVLDIQECPGGQNEYAGPSTLYSDPAMQSLCVDLWVELARRYGGRDSVGAYSLLAEPMSAPDSQARDAMYDQIVAALRAAGDDHLLVIHDGFRGVFGMPDPAEIGWDNVIYSTHLFEWGSDAVSDYEDLFPLWESSFGGMQESHDVPFYVGSFSTFRDADWAYESASLMADFFDRQGWSWTVWTYKRIDDPVEVELFGTQTGWGVRGRLQGSFDRPDLYRDDREVLMAKMRAYAEVDVAPNEELLAAIRRD